MNRKNGRQTLLGAIAAVSLCLSLYSAVPALRADRRQEIARLAEVMQWHPGTIVADIGAGDGSYSFAAAGIVGATGHVYSTEIDREKLKDLRAQVLQRKLANVSVIESAPGDTKLSSECCDAIFLRHVYHHITQPADFDKNLLRSLKPGARLAIIDFPPRSDLPPVEGVPQNRGGHGIPQKIVVEELTTAGFQVEKTIDNWSGEDYCVIFTKPAR